MEIDWKLENPKLKIQRSVIIIPTLNERQNLENLIPDIFGFLPGVNILVADDDSKDGTKELLKNLTTKFPNLLLLTREKNHGYGRAVLDGMRKALEKNFEYLITMDSDFSHDFRNIPEMVNVLTTKDIAIGSRYIKGGKIENWSFSRKLLSRFANFYVRIILGIKTHDMTTGFVGYRRSTVEKLVNKDIQSEGYSFLVETKYLLIKSGYSVGESPITFRERREGKSKMSSKVIWESIWLPWKLRKV